MQRILSPLRLPIPPHKHEFNEVFDRLPPSNPVQRQLQKRFRETNGIKIYSPFCLCKTAVSEVYGDTRLQIRQHLFSIHPHICRKYNKIKVL